VIFAVSEVMIGNDVHRRPVLERIAVTMYKCINT